MDKKADVEMMFPKINPLNQKITSRRLLKNRNSTNSIRVLYEHFAWISRYLARLS